MKNNKLSQHKKLIIVVDMINGFVTEGPLADHDIAKIVPEVTRVIDQTIEEGGLVAFVKDSHHLNSKEFESFPPHCIKGTKEAELIDELKPYEDFGLGISYEKNSTSTIFAKGFLEDIESMTKLEEIVIVGCCTDICITNLAIPLKNYLNEIDRDIRIIVPENAVETFNNQWHDRNEWNLMALAMMKQSGVKVVKEFNTETDIPNEWDTVN